MPLLREKLDRYVCFGTAIDGYRPREPHIDGICWFGWREDAELPVVDRAYMCILKSLCSYPDGLLPLKGFHDDLTVAIRGTNGDLN